MTQIPDSLFEQVANAIVPGLRQALDGMGMPAGSVSPTASITATIVINGREERVRMSVTLDPDEDDDQTEDDNDN